MNEPLKRATSSPPPVLGEGCTQRYDPAAMTPDTGCDFAEAAALWKELEDGQDKPANKDDEH
ncbi:hypothetical protein WG219_16555 [Ectopseudomonas mendocina]|uniref:Uncharacterized protein n=1 Tax=Ectopseudomonas mendocina TaxID=300 RepID=A0ABZ2RJK3_ECTME